jgi:phospholipase C
MNFSDPRKWQAKATACLLMFAISFFGFGAPARAGDDLDDDCHAIKTAAPIKHVIIIIVGENRSFDHLFATYEPKNKRERVLNLLSEGIINADGTPDPNFAKAHQYKIVYASPMSFAMDGKQYVAVAAGSALFTFGLP